MEHTKKTCFKAYLLKEVKEGKGTVGFNSEPFGNDIYNYKKTCMMDSSFMKNWSAVSLCTSIYSLSSLEDYKKDLLYMLLDPKVLQKLRVYSDESIVRWAFRNTYDITIRNIVDACSSESEKISSIGHELLREFLGKLDKIKSNNFDRYTKGKNLNNILNLDVDDLNCSVFTSEKQNHSSEYLKILFTLYTLGNRGLFSNTEENQVFLFSKIRAFELEGILSVSRNLIDSFASIKSLNDLEKFINGEGKNLKKFLDRKSIIEAFSYIKNKELSEWVLSNEKTPLITILNLACSDEKAIAASANKQLSVFLRNLEEYPSENLEKLLKENHLGKILSSTKAELVEQVKAKESRVKTWWSEFTKKTIGEKAQVGHIS